MAVPVDPLLRAVLENFVCVRVVQMWGLDLDRYQFDGFLTWAIFLLNADGTIYGRYGSRSESGHDAASDKLISVEGFKKTLERALEIHNEYTLRPDQLRQALADKNGPKRFWSKAEDIPEMQRMFQSKERYSSGVNQQCIHCHMVPRAEVASLHSLGRRVPDQYFWPFPLPQEIGMEMDPKEVATVLAVRADSIAANAGMRVGDRVVRINGQPILSTADIQWVLHHAKSPDTLEIEIDRKGESRRARLELDADWRLKLGDWRYMNQLMQGYLVNFRAWEATAATRGKLGLAADVLALEVSWVNQWKNKPPSLLREGDVIVAINNDGAQLSMGAFTAQLFRRPPGKALRLTVVRQTGETVNVELR